MSSDIPESLATLNSLPKNSLVSLDVSGAFTDGTHRFRIEQEANIEILSAEASFKDSDREEKGGDAYLGQIVDTDRAKILAYVYFEEIFREGEGGKAHGCQLFDIKKVLTNDAKVPHGRVPCINELHQMRKSQNYFVCLRLTVVQWFGQKGQIVGVDELAVNGYPLDIIDKKQFPSSGGQEVTLVRGLFPIVDLEERAIQKPHVFEPVYFSNLTWCSWCGSFIYGVLGKQGMRCKVCRFGVHYRCEKHATHACTGKPDPDANGDGTQPIDEPMSSGSGKSGRKHSSSAYLQNYVSSAIGGSGIAHDRDRNSGNGKEEEDDDDNLRLKRATTIGIVPATDPIKSQTTLDSPPAMNLVEGDLTTTDKVKRGDSAMALMEQVTHPVQTRARSDSRAERHRKAGERAALQKKKAEEAAARYALTKRAEREVDERLDRQLEEKVRQAQEEKENEKEKEKGVSGEKRFERYESEEDAGEVF